MINHFNFFPVHIDTGDIVAMIRQTSCCHAAYITHSKDRDFHEPTPLLTFAELSPQRKANQATIFAKSPDDLGSKERCIVKSALKHRQIVFTEDLIGTSMNDPLMWKAELEGQYTFFEYCAANLSVMHRKISGC